MQETLRQKKSRLEKIIHILEETYPDAKCALHFKNVFQLFVAVVLSAQSTDKQINKLTPRLFRELPDAKAFAKVPIEKIENLIYSSGFYKNKAKNLKAATKMILEQFDGKFPETMENILKLPGAGRKTANVILETGFHKIEGVVVDTHVLRIAKLLDLISKDSYGNAIKVEKELQKLLLKEKWGIFPHLMILHGRNICIARRPKCHQCPIVHLCPGRKF
ncbi:endonuclease III [Candidatus Peregrinibacteria bacterium]|nr:endonuclease III [Candidatus Peregrinibacteria bacterium]